MSAQRNNESRWREPSVAPRGERYRGDREPKLLIVAYVCSYYTRIHFLTAPSTS